MPTATVPVISQWPLPVSADLRVDFAPTPNHTSRQNHALAVQVSEHSFELVDTVVNITLTGRVDSSNALEQVTRTLNENWRPKLIARLFFTYELGVAKIQHV